MVGNLIAATRITINYTMLVWENCPVSVFLPAND